MTKFARILELPTTQCLLVVEYDEEEDAYKMNATMEYEGVRFTMGLGFHEEAQAYDCMKKYTLDNAMEVLNATKALLTAEE